MQTIDLVYIIDDDDILLMLTKILIQRNALYEKSEEFYNGQEALDRLKEAIEKGENLPKVILLDLNMPIVDGWQFLEEFLQLPLPVEIPIFIVTSSIDPRDIEEAKKHPSVKDYIMKPITADKLNMIFNTIILKKG